PSQARFAARPGGRRRGERAPRRGAEEFARPRDGDCDARRAWRALGALARLQGAAPAPASGLVPARRGERGGAAGGFFGPPSLVRLSACARSPFAPARNLPA